MKKDITRYEGLYLADEGGAVYSVRTGKALKPYINTGGYMRLNLYDKDGRAHHEYVHRLIAETFIQNPDGLPEVNHKNADRGDNRAINLEWIGRRGNVDYALSLGRWSKKKPVIAVNVKTGEQRAYPFLKYAARDLFGKPYALQFFRKRYGSVFQRGDWLIEVQDAV